MKNNFFVFDTNVLISALLIPSSIHRIALEKADEAGSIVFSNETLAELSNTLFRAKFDKYVSLNERREYIDRLEARAKLIKTHSDFQVCRDVKDNIFLNLAFDCEAMYIISGDKDLLVLDSFYKTKIISSADFVKVSEL